MITSSKNKKQKSPKTGKTTISKSVKDYGTDPFFVKKADQSQKFLGKHGFPDLQNKKWYFVQEYKRARIVAGFVFWVTE